MLLATTGRGELVVKHLVNEYGFDPLTFVQITSLMFEHKGFKFVVPDIDDWPEAMKISELGGYLIEVDRNDNIEAELIDFSLLNQDEPQDLAMQITHILDQIGEWEGVYGDWRDKGFSGA